MAANAGVNWYGKEFMLQIEAATAEMLDKAAFLVEANAKVNITNNGQVDTGFMRQSVYAVSPKGSTYNAPTTSPTGRQAAPARQPAENGALVGVAAEYALYQEARQSFLYRALQQVAATQGGAIVEAGRKVMD
jgi:hypothetical protein